MKTPTTDQEWIETLWALDGISYQQAGPIIGYSHKTVAVRAKRHRFRRLFGSRDGKWIEGPCLSCGTRHPVGDLSGERTCRQCNAVAGAVEDVRQELREQRRTDMAEERRKSRQRRREREQGVRPPLPEPCVFRARNGARIGGRLFRDARTAR